jgi:hypothetical protein
MTTERDEQYEGIPAWLAAVGFILGLLIAYVIWRLL